MQEQNDVSNEMLMEIEGPLSTTLPVEGSQPTPNDTIAEPDKLPRHRQVVILDPQDALALFQKVYQSLLQRMRFKRIFTEPWSMDQDAAIRINCRRDCFLRIPPPFRLPPTSLPIETIVGPKMTLESLTTQTTMPNIRKMLGGHTPRYFALLSRRESQPAPQLAIVPYVPSSTKALHGQLLTQGAAGNMELVLGVAKPTGPILKRKRPTDPAPEQQQQLRRHSVTFATSIQVADSNGKMKVVDEAAAMQENQESKRQRKEERAARKAERKRKRAQLGTESRKQQPDGSDESADPTRFSSRIDDEPSFTQPPETLVLTDARINTRPVVPPNPSTRRRTVSLVAPKLPRLNAMVLSKRPQEGQQLNPASANNQASDATTGAVGAAPKEGIEAEDGPKSEQAEQKQDQPQGANSFSQARFTHGETRTNMVAARPPGTPSLHKFFGTSGPSKGTDVANQSNAAHQTISKLKNHRVAQETKTTTIQDPKHVIPVPVGGNASTMKTQLHRERAASSKGDKAKRSEMQRPTKDSGVGAKGTERRLLRTEVSSKSVHEERPILTAKNNSGQATQPRQSMQWTKIRLEAQEASRSALLSPNQVNPSQPDGNLQTNAYAPSKSRDAQVARQMPLRGSLRMAEEALNPSTGADDEARTEKARRHNSRPMPLHPKAAPQKASARQLNHQPPCIPNIQETGPNQNVQRAIQPRLMVQCGHADHQSSFNVVPLKVLCSEGFLATWGDLVAELGSGRWAVLSSSGSGTIDGSLVDQTVGQSIEFCDSPLLEAAGVDIELPKRRAMLVYTTSALMNETDAKKIVVDVAKLATLGRYNRLLVLLCQDTPLSPRLIRYITQLQQATLCNGIQLPTAVFVKTTTPMSLSSSIASTIIGSYYKAAPPAHQSVSLYDDVRNTRLALSAGFLMTLNPKLSASGALQCLQFAKRLSEQANPLWALLHSQSIRKQIASASKTQDGQLDEVHPEAMADLYQVLWSTMR